MTGAGIAGSAALLGYGGAQANTKHGPAAARFHAQDILGQGEPVHAWYRYKFIGQTVMDTQLRTRRRASRSACSMR